MTLFKRFFKTDKQVEAIHKDSEKILNETTVEARKLASLLRKDGITLQIYIATGGTKR